VEFPEVSGDDSWKCEVETKVPGDCYSVNLDPGSVFQICPVLQSRNFDQSILWEDIKSELEAQSSNLDWLDLHSSLKTFPISEVVVHKIAASANDFDS
jgi:hypothetical protein